MSEIVVSDCIATAFYGISATPTSLHDTYQALLEWFKQCNLDPDLISVHGPGFSGKPLAFSKVNSKLSKSGFAGIRSFTLFALLRDWHVPTVDWLATAYLDVDESCFYIESRSSFATLDDKRYNATISECASQLRPSYGIAYHRDHSKGPGFYAIGLNIGSPIATGESYDEKLAISRWGDIGMKREVYRSGLLRGVYEHNYLSSAQLSRKIGQVPLEVWIRSDVTRGTLTKLNDRLSLWKVPEIQSESIHNELCRNAAIFDWRTFSG